jgi:hypothetical protein
MGARRLHMETVEIQELLSNWNKNGLLQEDPYTSKILSAATAVVVAASERQYMDRSDGEASIQHYYVIYIHS